MTEERELDYIIKAGLRRMDEAVEGVIAKYSPDIHIDNHGFEWDCGQLVGDRPQYGDEQRRHNYEMSAMIERAALGSRPIWMTEEEARNNPIHNNSYRNSLGDWK
tara:strand:- start:939 stop:1253 length:315 start_codon:yes stop_codon:yes gene_type:complete